MNNTTQLIHANTTGIASADMYRMSDKFSWWLADIGLPLDGLRLFHGLLHQTCRNLPGWSENVRQDDDGHMVSSMALKTQLGLGRAKSNRNIKHGISALRDTDCFDWIEFRHGTEWVTWRFTDEALAAILENNIYALLDAKGLSTTKNPTDFHIFSLVALHRRMRKPEFRLLIGQMQPWVDGVEADWSALRRPFVTALQRACATYNLTAVVLMKCTGTLRGIDQVVIRTRMPGNLWTVDELAKTGRYARKCMVVGPRSFLTCGPKKLHSTLSHLKAAHWDVDRIKPT